MNTLKTLVAKQPVWNVPTQVISIRRKDLIDILIEVACTYPELPQGRSVPIYVDRYDCGKPYFKADTEDYRTQPWEVARFAVSQIRNEVMILPWEDYRSVVTRVFNEVNLSVFVTKGVEVVS